MPIVRLSFFEIIKPLVGFGKVNPGVGKIRFKFSDALVVAQRFLVLLSFRRNLTQMHLDVSLVRGIGSHHFSSQQVFLCKFLEALTPLIVPDVEVFLAEPLLHFSQTSQVQSTLLFKLPCQWFHVDSTPLKLVKCNHSPTRLFVQCAVKRLLLDERIDVSNSALHSPENLLCIALRIRLCELLQVCQIVLFPELIQVLVEFLDSLL